MHSTVRDNPDEERYEIVVDGSVAGIAEYRARPGLIGFFHTEVDGAYKGQGLAGKLVDFALADVRARELDVFPFCTYVEQYIRKHPEHLELVPADRREAFGL